ncbi:twitching motility protein PilT [Planctomycetales bacterium]|nr:twitching motility protein PilT [Planctomycetales bacterium]GHT02566.1 twitching motility protein PilT [Planctomycetales bacterium]
MKRILLDLKVVLDYLDQRAGHEAAARVIDDCVLGKVAGYVCAHEITTLSYFLEKSLADKREVIKIIGKLLKMFDVIAVNAEILTRALSSNILDYEDAVVETSAQAQKIDAISTRNLKDFRASRIKAISPETYLAL